MMKSAVDIRKVKLFGYTLSFCFFLIHIGMFMLFRHYGVIPMARFNIFSIVFYIFTMLLMNKEQIWLYMVLVYLEVVVHMSLAVCFTGTDSGFQLSLLGMNALAFYAEYMTVNLKSRRVSGLLLSAAGMLAYLFSYAYSHLHPTAYMLPDSVAFWLHIVWGVIVFIINIFLLWLFFTTTLRSEHAALSASKAKSDFLANMSHEIRTPINAILGMNEMILHETGDREILEYSSDIQVAGKTLLSLINSILDFSKIEDGKMEIIPVNYSTASLINNLVHSILERAKAKGLDFVVDVDGKLPSTLWGDDIRISQVIMNLLTNAVKYTEKGSVTFTVHDNGRDEDGIKLFISVKDTGIGIREEDLPRLFETFERIEEKRNRSIEGTGLGMAIVNRLLPMMGSMLNVESVYGKGSEFSFTLRQRIVDGRPIGNYSERLYNSEAMKALSPSLQLTGARVLVVDDNEMNLKVAENLLKLDGIVPDLALSGFDAIEMIRKKDYDIVFLDHMMPKMDGIETLEKLRSLKLPKEGTAVIALTANAIVGAKEQYLAAGFDDYLSKPIEIPRLEELLVRYLSEKMFKPGGLKDGRPVQTAADTQDGRPVQTAADTQDGRPVQTAADTQDGRPVKTAMDTQDGRPVQTAAYTQDSTPVQTDPQEAASPADEIIRRLADQGIDTAAGLRYAGGSSPFYLEVLQSFTREAGDKAEAIRSDYENRDIHGYQIKVHTLKSQAKTVGADHLSSLAYEQEKAAKTGDLAMIDKGVDGLLEAYNDAAAVILCIMQTLSPGQMAGGPAADKDTPDKPQAVAAQAGKKATEETQGAVAPGAVAPAAYTRTDHFPADRTPADEIRVEEVAGMLRDASALLASFETARAEELLKKLSSFRFRGTYLGEQLEDIITSLDDFDTEKAAGLLEKFSASL